MKPFPDGASPETEAEERLQRQLAALRRPAPPGFTRGVMAALPGNGVRPYAWWPSGWGWLVPAVSGAAAALLLMFLWQGPATRHPDRVVVQFELHAPAARHVELVGDFTSWQPGSIQLDGPDESGHWSATVELPAGRYEYLFLVDGREWVTDPRADAHRPDGFGHMNAVMNL